jgi:hypothetical protein
MAKSKANNVLVEIGQKSLVDAEAMGAKIKFTPKYINQLARANLIPWVGVRNGVKVYRRFDPEAVMAALSHEVGAPPPNGDNTQAASVTRKRRSAGGPVARARDGAKAVRP